MKECLVKLYGERGWRCPKCGSDNEANLCILCGGFGSAKDPKKQNSGKQRKQYIVPQPVMADWLL